MGSVSELLWSVLFGSVGVGFFVYGKKQTLIVPLVCGLTFSLFTGQWLDFNQLADYYVRRLLSNSPLWSVR